MCESCGCTPSEEPIEDKVCSGCGKPTAECVCEPKDSVGGISGLEDVSDGALMYDAISEMARSSISDMRDAGMAKKIANQRKLEAKQAQIDATSAEIDAKREAAGDALTVPTLNSEEVKAAESSSEKTDEPPEKSSDEDNRNGQDER